MRRDPDPHADDDSGRLTDEGGLFDPENDLFRSQLKGFLLTSRGERCLLKTNDTLAREKTGLGSSMKAHEDLKDWYAEWVWQHTKFDPAVTGLVIGWVKIWLTGTLIAIALIMLTELWQHRFSWTIAVVFWATLLWTWRQLKPNRETIMRGKPRRGL